MITLQNYITVFHNGNQSSAAKMLGVTRNTLRKYKPNSEHDAYVINGVLYTPQGKGRGGSGE